MIKNFIAYHKYVFKVKKIETIILIIDFLLFMLSVHTLIKGWNSLIGSLRENLSTVLVIAGVILKFVYDVYKMIEEIKLSMYRDYGRISRGEVDLNTLMADPLGRREDGYEIIKCKIDDKTAENVMNSRLVDQHLISSQMSLSTDLKKEKQIFSFIKNNAADLMPFLKVKYRNSNADGKMFFNEQKLCLSKDIDIRKNLATCHRGSYYDTFLTNIICGSHLKSNRDNRIIASAEDFLPIRFHDNEIYLKDITSSVMNHEIGISTLAVTSDNYLILWTQNDAAQASNGLRAPSGSGSCDWKDKASNNFTEVITNAMKRELWEEGGSRNICRDYLDMGQTMILGYFRWMSKAGKPEFVGLTKVDFDLSSFIENRKEVYEREEYLISSIDDLKTIIHMIMDRGNVSVPLYMNLLCLERYYDSNKNELAEFIGMSNASN